MGWYREHRRDLPWRRTSDPYGIWVSEAMLQQTRVETVEGYWIRFMKRFPTAEALAEAPEEDLLAAWSGLGYYRRARSLQAAARVIVEEHGGEFPRDRDAVRALPGVGPYTAGAVLSIAFDAPEPLVDGNVERVFARLFELEGARGSRELVGECWRFAEALVPRRVAKSVATPGEWNQALMELGATVCTPKSPACGVCPVALSCAARRSGRQDQLPAPKPTREPIDVEIEIYVAAAGFGGEVRAGGVAHWLEQRPRTGRMAGLWQFPTVELTDGEPRLFPRDLPESPGFALEPEGDLFELKHGITHHRIRARVRSARIAGRPPAHWRSVRAADASELGLTGMARKVAQRLDSSLGGLFAEGSSS